jgi:hypothetical protein
MLPSMEAWSDSKLARRIIWAFVLTTTIVGTVGTFGGFYLLNAGALARAPGADGRHPLSTIGAILLSASVVVARPIFDLPWPEPFPAFTDMLLYWTLNGLLWGALAAGVVVFARRLRRRLNHR